MGCSNSTLQKENIYYLNYQLPENNKVVIKYGSKSQDVQVINGNLKHDVFIDLGESQAHVYLKNQKLRIDIFSGQKDIFKKLMLNYVLIQSKISVEPKNMKNIIPSYTNHWGIIMKSNGYYIFVFRNC